MAKKETPLDEKDNSNGDQLETHVKDLMEGRRDASTAPELGELPKPDKPLEIKILRDDETQGDEPVSAPELSVNELNSIEKSPSIESTVDDAIAPKSIVVSQKDEEDLPSDAKTDEAVDDIVRHESDELLAAEDEELQQAFKPVEKKKLGQRLKVAIIDIWRNPKKRKIAFVTLGVFVLLMGIVPTTRYFVLNTVGVRASASVQVIDASTLQPLKNVSVTIQNVTSKTNENGTATLEKLKLGDARLQVDRRAFASVERGVTVGWGSNPLGEERLEPTGTQYTFVVTDYLSGKGIAKAEAISGEASAFSDTGGKLVLTLDDPADELDITIKGEGYRSEEIKLDADTKTENQVRMVPDRKHVYISRRDAGRYDVYAAYIDGKEETLVLKGTGNEREDMVLVPHPTDEVVALVSTREGKHNDDGFLLSDLMVLDLRTKSMEKIQSSERIQVIGWFGERLAYVRVVAGTSAGNPQRNRLMAYHYKDDTNNELAAANYFNDVMAVEDRIYYAPSAAYQGGENVRLFSVKSDGSDKKTIRDKEVWNLFRTKYDHIAISSPGEWYDYRIGDALTTKLSGEPANLSSKVFTNSPDNKLSLWTETRDGKGVLVVHDIRSGQDKVLRTQGGLKNPTRWLNNSTVVYRIKTENETADYALSLDGGNPKKITDVTDTDGIDRWYYY